MKFYQIAWKGNLPGNIEFPCIVLTSNSWDDYGYRTTFDFEYYDEHGDIKFQNKAGIKILNKDSEVTNLTASFSGLPKQYCSLGQSLEYYSQLYSLGQSIYSA